MRFLNAFSINGEEKEVSLSRPPPRPPEAPSLSPPPSTPAQHTLL